ncbi:MAG: hypothetical protein CVU47_12960 [Chloroflexi bacterium HGW-Chloroflexi-9]|nr:MAG: hypothetical protein CVU47_12960 [Chloroflexi bacterium HGW-Chloroflexi-9]
MIDWLRATVAAHPDRLPVETLVAVGEQIARQRGIMAERRAGFRRVFREVVGPRWGALERALSERPRPPKPPAAAEPGAPAEEARDVPSESSSDGAHSSSPSGGPGPLMRMRHLFHL